MPRKKRPAPDAIPAEVIELPPVALKPSDAARYLGFSRTSLDGRRGIDRQRAEMGLPPIGPTWRVRGQSIFYLKADFDAWLLESSMERGEVKFRGHSFTAKSEEASS
jgi:hypothetical protein